MKTAEFAARPEYKFHGILRLVLALFVLWSHTFLYFFPELEGFSRFQLGIVAVASFFVLSGYLMTESGAYWYKGRALAFIANRYLRITPPFLVAAVISVSVHSLLLQADSVTLCSTETIPDNILSNGNVVLSIIESIFPFNAAVRQIAHLPDQISYHFVRYSWAIATELLFYWTMAAFIFLTPRLGERTALSLYLMGGLLCTIVGITSYSGQKFLGDSHPLVMLAQIVPYSRHLQWAPHFMIGVTLSLLTRESLTSNRVRMLILGLALILALLQLGLYASTLAGSPPLQVVLLYLCCLAMISLVVTSRGEGVAGTLERIIGKEFDQQSGNLSYPIYLNQYALAVLAVSLLPVLSVDIADVSGANRVVLYIAFNTFVVLAAGLIIAASDSAVSGLRDRIRGESI